MEAGSSLALPFPRSSIFRVLTRFGGRLPLTTEKCGDARPNPDFRETDSLLALLCFVGALRQRGRRRCFLDLSRLGITQDPGCCGGSAGARNFLVRFPGHVATRDG